ncbi:unnamed protein product [Diatraea saccharalis]|uniref:Uncharacterized protein n=1 Tax=Diatraea saccharalis TaxID=40085 RepID=A0A9N9RFF2_9NEOP|nr:unnamed protein product [Diatraea saccharalis]
MRFCLIFLFVIGACTVLASPPEERSLVRQRRQTDILDNTRRLIEDLIANLRSAAEDALEAVKIFESGLLEQAKLVREKFLEDLQRLKERITETIQTVVDKITGSGLAVKECVNSFRDNAAALFNETLTKSMDCADDRIAEISIQVQNLKNYSEEALTFADAALSEMKKCIDDNPGSIFSVGSCLGRVALKTEAKSVVFVTQSAISIGRVNLALTTLPAALEVCVGTHLVSAGLATTKIIFEIGGCSASSVFSNLIGNSV